ncbi:unnamed protein product [Effrenium voratum]|nr:unnamed protein product [Effrenium voratum]
MAFRVQLLALTKLVLPKHLPRMLLRAVSWLFLAAWLADAGQPSLRSTSLESKKVRIAELKAEIAHEKAELSKVNADLAARHAVEEAPSINAEALAINAEAAEVAKSVKDTEQQDVLRASQRARHDARSRTAKRLLARFRAAADKAVQATRKAQRGLHRAEAGAPTSSSMEETGAGQSARLKALQKEASKERAELQDLQQKLARSKAAIEKVKMATSDVKRTTARVTGQSSKELLSTDRSIELAKLQQLVRQLKSDKAEENVAEAQEHRAHEAVINDMKELEVLEKKLQEDGKKMQ